MQTKQFLCGVLAVLFVNAISTGEETPSGKRVGDRYEIENVGSFDNSRNPREWRELATEDLKQRKSRVFISVDDAAPTSIVFSVSPELETAQTSKEIFIEKTIKAFLDSPGDIVFKDVRVQKYQKTEKEHDWTCISIDRTDSQGNRMLTEFMVRFEDVVYQFQLSASTKDGLANLVRIAESFEPDQKIRSAPSK
jgi:hypothetical protein